ncbi:uncharacterized protein LOC116792419 isoform X1 [Chiroxiphia lanceolata]|uniref:uncharacterized protein LOC116792419 isoform X1 n=1 Tax=Chiroxiphia lanceolata TaxID=296741 RepID=UPI0013CF27FF|nr:uncharacterized protein LOC116792419 isoform X1 [Chiroxiphia lanceolata]
MALALRLFLLLLLAVALHARAAQAAPVPARGADEDTGNVSPLHWLREVLKPFRPPAGVSTGKTFPGPVLVPPHEPNSHGRGKNQPTGEKKSFDSNEVLKEIMKELQRGHNAAGATTRAPKIQESTGRDFCQGTHCLIVIMASMFGGQLAIMLSCAGIWYWRVRKRLLSAPAPAQPNTSVRKKQISHLSSHTLYPAMLPQLQNLQVQEPPKRAPLPLSPLALHSNQV